MIKVVKLLFIEKMFYVFGYFNYVIMFILLIELMSERIKIYNNVSF